jgi:hypothetical protein
VAVSVTPVVYPRLRPHPTKRVARQVTGCAHAPGIDVPTISVFYGIVIRMFFRDRSPPHFHAAYAGRSAAIAIDSFFFGVFAALRDPKAFAQVRCEHGYVEWPGDLDLAPDAMYAEIRKRGRWVLE